MKLMSILELMDGDEMIEVSDMDTPVDRMMLYAGPVKVCRRIGKLRHNKVAALVVNNNTLHVLVEAEQGKEDE